MIIELAASVCLIFEPEHCDKITFAFEAVNPIACMIEGQARLASWVVDHPNWRINTIICGARGTPGLNRGP